MKDVTDPIDVSTRRDLLIKGGAGFGALALNWMMRNEPGFAADAKSFSGPHHSARAKRVIFLYMEGGPSHIDTFDPKPLLNKLAGKPLPESFGRIITPMGEDRAPLLESKRKWKQHGECGTWVSDWLPHQAKHADDIAVIRSLWGDGINHAGGCCQMNTGSPLAGRPSLGAWVSYGLGTENANLPAFVVMRDNNRDVAGGVRNWGTGFMPATYQGVPLSATGAPFPNLRPPKSVTSPRQERKLKLLDELNRDHALNRKQQSQLDARIKSYELAFRMQAHAPEAVDLSKETKETFELYGVNESATAKMGRLCLQARRFAERGVRFIQVYHGAGSRWDAHAGIEKNHTTMCREMDKPVSGLLTDLKRRGLLEDTLVIWGGEFGRTPMSEKGDGRDHNPSGFTMWLAGGGVKGGQVLGKTDDLGLRAIEDRLHIHDFHATLLHLLGLHHMKLVYHHKGRPERPTINEGEFYEKVVR